MELLRDADLRPLTTFGVPARAAYLGRFDDADQLRTLLSLPALHGVPHMVLGGGSNVLFTRDYEGAILLNEVPGIAVVHEDSDHVWVRAGAGVTWHELVRWTVERGWGGLENLSLIPGKVGAAPMQNIGAYGVELKDHFHELEALRTSDGEVVTFDADACAFGYRESFFKREGRGHFVILHVTFRLDRSPALHLSYGTIRQELEKRGVHAPTVADVSAAVIAIRRSKLPDPAELGNAGSFFKNPVVPVELANRIRQAHPDLVSYPASEGMVKLAAGWLIERAGWKGHRANGHGVHKDQALVLVNHGGATGQAVYDLSEQILSDIRAKFGVDLEREVNII
jgi:UDP-N-acetylmuramate dehydrogenase